MVTDLAHHIQATSLMDTHEHLRGEQEYLDNGPDVLQDLFDNYMPGDLLVAGATEAAVQRLLDATDPDVAARFDGVRAAWELSKYTGYGEAVRLIAQRVYGIDELTPETLATAQAHAKPRLPGDRLRILKEIGNLDHVQIDHFQWQCLPNTSGLDFFLYDLSWMTFCAGRFDVAALQQETQVDVHDLNGLRVATAALFEKYGPCAIAVKSQHAYERTLCWRERDEADVERVLLRQLAGAQLSEEERLCLGDWCWARGVELAIEHNLPFKIHTGYYYGVNHMRVERIASGHMCELFLRYPASRFVLMHIAYPYSDELVAMAKHFPNVYVDMCWAWSIDPYSACDFVRRMLHAVPVNKLFAFGGDTSWPNAAVAYSIQARQWLTRALQAEVNEGMLSERAAIALATQLMRTNQEQCFDLAGTRAAIRAAAQAMEDAHGESG